MKAYVSPFAHESVRGYVSALCANSNSSFTVWARKLGYRSPRSIAMVASGVRPAPLGLLTQLARHQQLSAPEARYLILLGEKERLARQGKSVEGVEKELAEIRPAAVARRRRILSENLLAIAADWAFFPAKQLLDSVNFQPRPEWLAKRLRSKIDTLKARRILEGLLASGAAGVDPLTGKWISLDQVGWFSPMEYSSQAIRKYHRAMLNRAREALEEQAIDIREFQGLTFRLDPRRIPEAKEFARQFVCEFEKRFDAPRSAQEAEVYQFNLNFFALTETEPVARP